MIKVNKSKLLRKFEDVVHIGSMTVSTSNLLRERQKRVKKTTNLLNAQQQSAMKPNELNVNYLILIREIKFSEQT